MTLVIEVIVVTVIILMVCHAAYVHTNWVDTSWGECIACQRCPNLFRDTEGLMATMELQCTKGENPWGSSIFEVRPTNKCIHNEK